jgi:CheY-like chemotaxis protein
MALFGFGKDKKGSGMATEQVLAYLEEAQRNRTAFTLIGPKRSEVPATVQGVNEGDGTVTFQAALPMSVDKGSRIELIFIADGLRIWGSTTIAEARGSVVTALLPDGLELRERRAQPRARLHPKEGTTLTALTGLFDGVGITGTVENLSESGARVRVEKAMNLKGEKRLPLGTSLVPHGQPFLLIKLNKAPKCQAVMELEGRAVFLDSQVGGLVMGVAFDKPRSDIASSIRGLVNSRTTTIPSSLPNKTRRRPEAPAPTPEPAPAAKAAPAEKEAPAAAALAPSAAAEPASAPVTAAEAPETQAPGSPKSDVRTLLKKRTRSVLALVHSPAFAMMLKDFLQEEGYGKVLVTTDQKEFLVDLQQPNLSALLIDGEFSAMEALQFVSQLTADNALPPIILAVEAASAAVVLAAHRVGAAHLLVKPYSLDGAFSDLLNQVMGI